MRSWLLTALALSTAAVIVAGAWASSPDKSRATLEAKYLARPNDYVEVAGIRLHVRDTGHKTAPAIVLLHGFGSSLHTWEPWAEALAATHRVVSYDLPGSGLTGADPTGDYSDTRGIAVLAALLDRLGIARATLAGNSMGGKLAWRFAAAHPERVEKLILISPDGFASPGFDYGKRPDVPAFLHLMKYALPKSMLRSNLAPAYGDPSRLTDDTVTRYHDMMLAPGVRGAMLDRMGQVLLEPPEQLLRKIEAPTLLLWGEKDAMIPFSNAADYLKAMPRARLVSFPHLGHVPHEEAPAETVAAVKAFLGE